MKQTKSTLLHSDIRTMFENMAGDICTLAKECGCAEEFKDRLSEILSSPDYGEYSQAKANLKYLSDCDGKTVMELSTGNDMEINTMTLLWGWLNMTVPDNEASVDFLIDILHQFTRLHEDAPSTPDRETIDKWMLRWPSGLDKDVVNIRRKNRERIIGILVERIAKNRSSNSRYSFQEGMGEQEKIDKVKEWWYDYRFQLAMAARSIRELDRYLGHTQTPEIKEIYHQARKKGIPVFVTPYYLSLLNTGKRGYDDAAIRSYVLYSRELVETFGTIRAWEKEDIVEAGKPNAAGWLLPDGHNIHRRYPDVAILIPDSMGRACGGLCASCQRMYDFQSRRLNFDFDKLKPNETWERKLQRLMKYFEEDSQICDILITGGDALMSQNKTLRNILKAVLKMAKKKKAANANRPDGEKYAEIKRIRLGTRLPVYLPMRINGELLDILAEFKAEAEKAGISQFFIQTHFQSPLELTPESRDAIIRIQSTGWTIINQLVFNVAASRRGHTAKLRKELNQYGILCYYTFSVKGFRENHAVFAPNSRSMQECEEEKAAGRLSPEEENEFLGKYIASTFRNAEIRECCERKGIPFLATDRNVLNLPGIGKSMTFRLAGITPDGKRILEFSHDHTRHHSPVINSMKEVYIVENKSIYEYLVQLEGMGEDIAEYSSIWDYTEGKTERRFGLYLYPPQDFTITEEYTNAAVGNNG